ncbi:MAG: hypothetical protein DIZ80_16175 [endosymbiont of Galathealinum brachiosum]|uniref:Cytochrome C n=1 Tax=endosymbiont of Galathealinum brachiosum TaxID=2200906 RepID=A0A370DBD8_9GAMM|nr:MAG: hypothetical protein DIZ80_16175 [endosymbiont of Galathealinum brachiosum]
MQLSLKHRAFTLLVTTLIIAGNIGCAQVRKLTYSEDFTYVEDREVKSLMRKMSKGVERLGQIAEKASTNNRTQQQQIISELGDLQSIAARLSAGHTQTNQLFIRDHIEQFITDIGEAKMFAKTTPPDYSKIGDIVNSCEECHTSR